MRRLRPAMEAVGLSACGQCSWQDWCEWHAWQPPLAATAWRRSAFPASRGIIHERPSAIERRRPEIVGIPAHGIAGGIAHAAIDAFDGGVSGNPRRAVRPDLLDSVAPRLRRHERALRLLPLLEEGAHVGDQILDDGQVLKRPDLEASALGHARYMRAAGPARPAVHRHGTGAAHADPAGKTV